MKRDTKLTGDISEQMVALELMKQGFDVLHPVGDRLPFDLVSHESGEFIRIQVKTAYLDEGRWVANTRRARTNRKESKFTPVDTVNCDFFVFVVQPRNEFYVFPATFVAQYKSSVSVQQWTEYLNNWEQLRGGEVSPGVS